LLQGRGNKSSHPRERDLKPRKQTDVRKREDSMSMNNSQELCKRWPINRRTADESSGTLRERYYTSKGKGKGNREKKKQKTKKSQCP